LKRAVVRNFFRRQWRQLQCALIDPKKNEILGRSSLSALAPEQILEAQFAAPRDREKWRCRKKVAGKNQPRPKNAN